MADLVPELEDRRRRAIAAFLGAGLQPAPPIALTVSALADARRSVAACRARDEPVGAWLAGRARLRGISENAAVLVALELPQHRDEVARSYAGRYPDRVGLLTELLAVVHAEGLPRGR